MYSLLKRGLFAMDAETAHTWALRAARMAQSSRGLWRNVFAFDDPRLAQNIGGIDFSAPLGLAAGVDKNAEAVASWFALGLGFVEVGAVTAQPSVGNPKPRAFRLPQDRALINRMGLNNDGAEIISQRLQRVNRRMFGPVGVNLAKTHDPQILGSAAIEDFLQSFRCVAPHADYVALNVSCPNTAEGKTFEDPEAFAALLAAIQQEKQRLELRVPIWVKLSPPSASSCVDADGRLGEIIDLGKAGGVAGWIASNTAPDRNGLVSDPALVASIGRGGLSGRPLAQRSTALVRYLFRRCDGEIPIVGVGGIFDAEDAYEKILAGASLLQIYTGLVYKGPFVIKQIHQGLLRLLARDHWDHLSKAVGYRAL